MVEARRSGIPRLPLYAFQWSKGILLPPNQEGKENLSIRRVLPQQLIKQNRMRRTRFVASKISHLHFHSLSHPFTFNSSQSASLFCFRIAPQQHDVASFSVSIITVYVAMVTNKLITLTSTDSLVDWVQSLYNGEVYPWICIAYAPSVRFDSPTLLLETSLISWSVLILSSLTLLSHAVFHIVLAIEGDQWSTADAQWAELIGFIRVVFLAFLLCANRWFTYPFWISSQGRMLLIVACCTTNCWD
ncbi:unnamed protein product [Sphenostylis stenocarpa]|uniref:Uncharacterized protein n=1 Tax=Sphenostylis stenocarpa TaxID=92480 RepID=A0AA86VFQ8_9FABA|nr:unnamed protein product [Sphenostylis stenocarpa]